MKKKPYIPTFSVRAKAERDRNKNLTTRFNRSLVKKQLQGLINFENNPNISVDDLVDMIEQDHNSLPEPRPRYYDDLNPNLFVEGKANRILLSHYWELKHDGMLLEFIQIGQNYGVFIPKTIVQECKGHEYLSRMIAVGGVVSIIEHLDSNRFKKEIDYMIESMEIEIRL